MLFCMIGLILDVGVIDDVFYKKFWCFILLPRSMGTSSETERELGGALALIVHIMTNFFVFRP
jgi:hypothetical protein